MENCTSDAPGRIPIGCTNFFSAASSALFCTAAALLIDREAPCFHRQALNVLLAGALYTLPQLFMPMAARYLITRFSSRNTLAYSRWADFGLLIPGSMALGMIHFTGALPLWGIILLLGASYALYRPALKIYIAETFPKAELSAGGGITESTTFAGIISGVILAVIAIQMEYAGTFPLWSAGLFAAFCAGFGALQAMKLNPTLALSPRLRFANMPRTWFETLRRQEHAKELVLTGIGESYVFGTIIFISSFAIQYVAEHLSSGSEDLLQLYSIMAAPALGAFFGCLLGVPLSRKNVEIGLVPPAALGVVLCSLLIGFLPGLEGKLFQSGLLGVLLFLLGGCSGMMLIPLQGYPLYFVRKELRNPYFSWASFPFGILLLAAIVLSFGMYELKISIPAMAVGFALLTCIVSVATFLLMPQFLLRMCMKLLLLTIYRLRVWNPERIPEEGPALLVANRASFVDMLFISGCTTRPVRFMMHESYYNFPLLRPLFDAVGFLEVPANKPKKLVQLFETTRELLRKGELICIFPEGDITRNGVMSSFKDGISTLLPPEMKVPVIPLRIGMTWGSIFSCYYGKFALRWPAELPHPASVTVGKPMPPESNAYEIRIILSELAAETELVPRPEERPFHSQFAYMAKRYPFRRCIGEFNGENWKEPYNIQLLTFAVLLSRKIRKRCTEEETYVGMMLPNSVAAAASVFAIQMADRVPAVLNYTSSAEAMDHAIKKANIKHILTSRRFIEKLKMPPRPEMIFIEDMVPRLGGTFKKVYWLICCIIFPAKELMKLVSPVSWKDVNRQAVLIFSSGSTGTPKGVMLTHHNINGDVSAVIKSIGWTKKDRVLGNLPLFHSFGMSVCFWLPVLTGANVTFVPNPVDARAGTTAIRERKVSVLMATPGFLMLYMRSGKPEDFKSLRLTVTGAEKLRGDIAERYYKMTGLAIAEGYGCTELSPIVSVNLANSRMELGVEIAKRGSIGPPITGVCVKIVDPDTFELRPEDTDGLMIVKGANVMLGYLGEPEKTAEVIRDNWYITGDIARMDRNGFITVTGRLSRFSKIAGEMIPHELVEREINNILLPDSRIVAVSSAADARRGEKLLVFYTDPKQVHPEELIKAMREHGVPNLWIPRAENFIPVPALPALGSGKLDLQKLGAMSREYDEI